MKVSENFGKMTLCSGQFDGLRKMSLDLRPFCLVLTGYVLT